LSKTRLGTIAGTVALALSLAVIRPNAPAAATLATLTLSWRARPTLLLRVVPRVRFVLPAPRVPADLAIQSEAGRTVGRWSLFGFSSLSVELPSAALPDGGYILRVCRAGSAEVLAEYSFRVLKN